MTNNKQPSEQDREDERNRFEAAWQGVSERKASEKNAAWHLWQICASQQRAVYDVSKSRPGDNRLHCKQTSEQDQEKAREIARKHYPNDDRPGVSYYGDIERLANDIAAALSEARAQGPVVVWPDPRCPVPDNALSDAACIGFNTALDEFRRLNPHLFREDEGT